MPYIRRAAKEMSDRRPRGGAMSRRQGCGEAGPGRPCRRA